MLGPQANKVMSRGLDEPVHLQQRADEVIE
jgi:hypothetical protein